ncbi:MAG: cbb3-type cytochrome c oxidase N-terminal domain-containing protein [Bacillota bacterium]
MRNANPFEKSKKTSSRNWKVILFQLLLALFIFPGFQSMLFSQTGTETANSPAVPEAPVDYEGFLKTATLIFAVMLMIVLWFIIVYSTRPLKEGKQKSAGSLWAVLRDKLSAAAPLEKEQDIVMEDNFDGIRELNNKIPPWFNILFYGTIIFSLIYLLTFHVFKTGKLSIDEYNEEMQAADLQKEILFRTGKLITENNVTQLKDAGALQSGKDVYVSKCSVCHGRQGEGLVGPNLTDDYWIHGGSIKDVFRIIKYGVPAKGMLTWQNQLSPREIQDVASYVLSLHGTNPPNAKPPQGDKYMVTADSTKAPIGANVNKGNF